MDPKTTCTTSYIPGPGRYSLELPVAMREAPPVASPAKVLPPWLRGPPGPCERAHVGPWLLVRPVHGGRRQGQRHEGGVRIAGSLGEETAGGGGGGRGHGQGGWESGQGVRVRDLWGWGSHGRGLRGAPLRNSCDSRTPSALPSACLHASPTSMQAHLMQPQHCSRLWANLSYILLAPLAASASVNGDSPPVPGAPSAVTLGFSAPPCAP